MSIQSTQKQLVSTNTKDFVKQFSEFYQTILYFNEIVQEIV